MLKQSTELLSTLLKDVLGTSLLQDIAIDVSTPTQKYCDHQATLFIDSIHVVQGHSKYVHIAGHFIRDLSYVRFDNQQVIFSQNL